jgi:hypothetical protein
LSGFSRIETFSRWWYYLNLKPFSRSRSWRKDERTGNADSVDKLRVAFRTPEREVVAAHTFARGERHGPGLALRTLNRHVIGHHFHSVKTRHLSARFLTGPVGPVDRHDAQPAPANFREQHSRPLLARLAHEANARFEIGLYLLTQTFIIPQEAVVG